MSGLDPIGRREVREIILRLRTTGRTVLFSSHILSDAEMLCSRVGILAHGRLVAAGVLDELTAQGRAGWEVVVTGLTAGVAERLRPRVRSLTIIADGWYAIELAGDSSGTLVAELAATGASSCRCRRCGRRSKTSSGTAGDSIMNVHRVGLVARQRVQGVRDRAVCDAGFVLLRDRVDPHRTAHGGQDLKIIMTSVWPRLKWPAR
jgi:ABC-type sulfate/molybdate transport systems ATPase subunit